MASTSKVQNVIAIDTDVGAGAVTWWRLTNVDHAAFCAALTAVGIPEKLHPSAVDDQVALKRALDYDIAKGRNLRVIPLGKSSAYAVERTTVHDTDVTHTTVLKVILKEDGGLHTWECDDSGADAKLRSVFDSWRNRLDGYDVGMWLTTRLLPSLNALSLRDKGGIYYVPPTTIATYQAVAGAITEQGGGRVFEMPALECEKAVDAILDAVTREAEEAAATMEDELINQDLGARALKNRVAKLDKVLSKVGSYEAMLGRNLAELHNRFEALSAQMSAAILTADAADADAEENAA